MGKRADQRPDVYIGPKSVLDELKGRGLKMSRSTLGRAIKSGKIRREPGVGFLAEEVDRFATTLSLRNAPGTPGGVDLDAADLAREKLAAEVARIRNIVRKQDMDYQRETGRLCKSGDFYLAIAERLSILRSRFNTLARVHALEYVKMTPDDFVDAVTSDFALLLHEFSRPPEYESEEVPDVFKEGRDVAGKTERQEKPHGGHDED